MIIGVLEYGEVRIYDDLDAALAEWGPYPSDLLSYVIVLYDENGVWLEPVATPGPRRWLGLRRGIDRVTLRPSVSPRQPVDPIGLALEEAEDLVPNRHFASLAELRARFPFTGAAAGIGHEGADGRPGGEGPRSRAAPGRSEVRLLSGGPPFLVIRPGLAFWVEDRPPELWSATLQSFEEGCFRDALCCDLGASSRRVIGSELAAPPALLDRLLPWRQVPVVVTLGPPRPVDRDEIVALLAGVLRGDSEFLDHLECPPEELLQRFAAAADMAELLQIAREID